VELVYRILPGSGAADIPFSLLTPTPTRVEGLEGWVESTAAGPPASPVSLSLNEIRDHYWEGSVQLPGGVSPDTLILRLRYRVEGARAGDGRITLPLLAPGWVPEDPTPRTFQAHLEIPPGLVVTGSFPTSVLSRPDPRAGGSLVLGLQGVPSMVILWTTRGDPPFLTAERSVELLVVILLLLMVALGLRHLSGGER
jgi:hypothetical protein